MKNVADKAAFTFYIFIFVFLYLNARGESPVE